MPGSDLWVLLGVVFVAGLLAMLFFIPTEQRRARNRQGESGRRTADDAPQKDWQATALRLEKHIQDLRRQIDELQKSNKHWERETFIQSEKYKKLQEKMAQERNWQQKEAADFAKTSQQMKKLKEDRLSLEQSLGEEHGMRLRLERELRENKDEVSRLQELERQLNNQLEQLKAQAAVFRKDTAELRAVNAELSSQLAKKESDVQWVAKTEYDRLAQELKNKEVELAHWKKKSA